VARWREQLVGVWPPRVLRAAQRSVWSRTVLLELGCGWERGRITIPVRDGSGSLRGVLRYAPRHDHAPKILGAPGTRLGLVPHPAAIPAGWMLLVEGPPDMISARSRGLPAVAVPGDHAWEAEWASLLAGRQVSLIMDCDRAGRQAAQRIAGDLDAAGAAARVIDLAPGRADGYDLTDWLADRRDLARRKLASALGAPASSEVA
jgi:DNA primase